MPRAANLEDIEILFDGGYFPSTPTLAPDEYQRSIRRGSNVWLRSGSKMDVARGLLETSSQNVGARIFAADIQRATIAGGLVGSRLPYAGLQRYQHACLLFLSELTSQQVYLNEAAPAGVVTSTTAGRLRVSIPNGSGGYDTFDAGFAKPVLQSSDVTVLTAGAGIFGQRAMAGKIGVAIAPWRSKTNAVGPLSEIIYNNIQPTGSSLIRIDPPNAVSGQDGWIYAGSRWRDESGLMKVVRYVYLTPRGTFTATNGSPSITLGVNTFFTQDLRRGDQITIDGGSYEVGDFVAEADITLTSNFTGVTGAGKTMTINTMAANWYDNELTINLETEVFRPPRAAGLISYAGLILIWGCRGESSNSATGPAIFPLLKSNPEHVGFTPIITASGSDLVNVLGADGPLYLMTTTGLEVASFTGDPNEPYKVRIIAEPGFKAATNGCLYKDYYYGYNNKPLRTRARENIDVEFAKPVWEDMKLWDSTRVIVCVDPDNDAILFIYDDGASTTVIPFLAQLNMWSPPINFSARIIDTQVVNGKLYVTYLSGGVYRVNQWEGGAGIGGTRYAAAQYSNSKLRRGRVKNLAFVGKAGTLRVYAATPDAAVPDVSNAGAAAVSFNLSDTDKVEPENWTNIEAKALALRVDFTSDDGKLDKLTVGVLPRSERR